MEDESRRSFVPPWLPAFREASEWWLVALLVLPIADVVLARTAVGLVHGAAVLFVWVVVNTVVLWCFGRPQQIPPRAVVFGGAAATMLGFEALLV